MPIERYKNYFAHSGPEPLTLCLPTKDSAALLEETLGRALASIKASPFRLHTVLVADASDDGTVDLLKEQLEDEGANLECNTEALSLPAARQWLIESVPTDWLWFLDDDARVEPDYLRRLSDSVSPLVGAVQGRKASRVAESEAKWTRRRSRRGGTHATLVRRKAVEGIEIPADLEVLEDEYIRRYIESRGYLWVFNHQAVFRHEGQGRHPTGWMEGRLAGKYGLKPFHETALNVPYSLAKRQNPTPHLLRSLGWLYGRATAR